MSAVAVTAKVECDVCKLDMLNERTARKILLANRLGLVCSLQCAKKWLDTMWSALYGSAH
jgi:hypothetical protein